MFGTTGAFGSTGGAFGQQQQQQPGQQPGQQPLFGQTAGAGFGGFGQQQQPPFGQQTSVTPAFGVSSTPAFGAGAGTTGFGASTGSAFGAQPRQAFGSTGGGLFGGGSSTAPSTAGFGASSTTPGFGSSVTSGSLFGTKPATNSFGFGAGVTGQSSFGAPATTSGFGSSSFGSSSVAGQSLPPQGTATQPFQPYTEKEGNTLTSQTLTYQSISAMQLYRNWSFEELRLLDYQQGRKSASGTGGFGQTPGFGTPAFGSNVSQPGGLFGSMSAATTTGTGLFGQAQAGTPGGFGTGGFGSSTTTGFGTTSSGAFGAKPANTGLFGQSATPAFGTSQPAPAFGSTTTTPAPFGGGFGSSTTPAFGVTAQKPAFGFGASTTAPSAFATTSAPPLFGQLTTAPAFGTSQPAQTGFAVTSTPFTFGNAAQPSTASAFGAKPTTAPGFNFTGGLGTATKPPAFGFGQTATQSIPASSMGLFGQTSTTATPLFSGTAQPSTGLFGQTTSTAPPFGSSLFAPKMATTTTTTAPFNLGQTYAPGSTGFGGFTGLGGTSMLGATTAQSTGPPLQASLNENAYGQSPLFASPQKDKPSSGLAASAGPLATPARPAVATPLSSSVHRSALSMYKKASPMSAARTKQLRFASSSTSSPTTASPAKTSGHLFDGKSDIESFGTSMLVPRRSIKKLVITPRARSVPATGETGGHANGIDPSLEAEAEESNLSVSGPSSSFTPRKTDRPTPGATPGSARSHASETSPTRSPERGKYWTSPTIASLRKLPAEQLKSVKDFHVGRYGFGQIRFLDPVDLTEITEGLDAIPGDIVQFADRSCTVYSDDENKPAMGHGLNLPAVVSLENCFFVDKATREPVRDVTDRRYIRHLNRLKRQPATEFIDFLSETGTWVFRVEHFSRYGIFDDDDAEGEGSQDESASREGTPRREVDNQMEMSSPTSSAGPKRAPFEFLNDNEMEEDDHIQDAELSSREMMPVFGANRSKNMPSAAASSKLAGTKPAPHHVSRQTHSPPSSDDADSENEITRVPNTFFQPPPSRRIRKQARIEYTRSVLYGKTCEVADAGLMMNRSFRVGWGPGGRIVHGGRLCGRKDIFNEIDEKEETSKDEPSALACVTLEKVRVFRAAPEEIQKQRHVISLITQLQSCEIVSTMDKGPSVITRGNVPFCRLTDMVKEAPDGIFNDAEGLFWKLGCALWDPIEWAPEFEQLQPPERHRVNSLKRKDMVSSWLQEAVRATSLRDEREASTRGEDPAAGRAFSLLTGFFVEEACRVLMNAGDRRLATLTAQAGQDTTVRQLIYEQLVRWNKLKVSEHMPRETLRVFHLLAGSIRRAEVDGVKSRQELLVGEGLDWKRAFGLELWYGQYRHDGVGECVLSFDSSWNDTVSAAPAMRIAPPVPWYVEDMGTDHLDGAALARMPRDAPWELLQLYSQPERPLDLVCKPAGFSSDLMDYRIPWLLYRKLAGSLAVRGFMDMDSELGSRLAEYITASLSFQLENLGLWQWAVFVSLHHFDADMRAKAVCELISRNAPTCYEEQSEEWREGVKFLRETLHIPATWLHEARALRARYDGDVYEETLALLAAGHHAAAHARIVMILAPEMIVKGSSDELIRLLTAIDAQEVPNWEAEGKMYLEYIDVVSKVPYLVATGVELGGVTEVKERLQHLLKLVSDAMGARRSEGYPFAGARSDLRRNVALADMAANLSNCLQDLEPLVHNKEVIEQTNMCFNRVRLPVDQRIHRLHKLTNTYFTSLAAY